ncbi:prefoldin subunit [Archaeoglobus sp.]
MISPFFDQENRLLYLKKSLLTYERMLKEIENAERMLERNPKRIYRIVGNLIFEIDLKEAEEFLKKFETAVKSQINKLKNEISKFENTR